MKAYTYTLLLKPDPRTIEEYKAHHRAVWPEVLESMKRVGILGNDIYLLGDRLVSILYTTDSFDPETALVEYARLDPKVGEWDRLMRTFQRPAPEAREGEWWAPMELVFHHADPSLSLEPGRGRE